MEVAVYLFSDALHVIHRCSHKNSRVLNTTTFATKREKNKNKKKKGRKEKTMFSNIFINLSYLILSILTLYRMENIILNIEITFRIVN